MLNLKRLVHAHWSEIKLLFIYETFVYYLFLKNFNLKKIKMFEFFP